MQASNLEQYLKARKEDREYREVLKDVITIASSELGLMTITISCQKVILGNGYDCPNSANYYYLQNW